MTDIPDLNNNELWICMAELKQRHGSLLEDKEYLFRSKNPLNHATPASTPMVSSNSLAQGGGIP